MSTNDFQLERGNAEHLTEFQREKAKYFFRVNLDFENKEHITWADVDFYIQFHITTAGKDGLSGGDLASRLERAVRALWEFIHDQLPLPEKDRDRLTLDQALDTWASLVDYIIEKDHLPPVVDDLVKLGFELYSTDNQTSIQPIAFDQLFHQMQLGRPYALMAFKILTESGTVPLTYERVEKLVREVITSSDDEHPSHFLLPGFFKTITKKNRSASPSSNSETSEKKSSAVSSPRTPSTPERRKSPSPLPPPSSPTATAAEKKEEKPPSPRVASPKPVSTRTTNAAALRDEDEGIRQLLRFYHIDDGDIIEVAAGSVQRVVLVHPERPLPAYIQENKELLQKIYPNDPPAPVEQPRTIPQPRREPPKREVPPGTEEKIVSNVLKELAPFIEKRVSEELNRIRDGKASSSAAGESDDDDDDDGFIPFPFMFAGPPSNGQQQRQGNGLPPLLLAMMNDLARSAAAAGNPDANSSGSPPTGPTGPMGMEGYMMFVNGEPRF